MEKLVWSKVKQFLEELRCEDIDKKSKVETREFLTAKRNLRGKSILYQQSIVDIQKEDHEKIKNYVETLKECSFEECQEAYIQG